MSNMFDQRYEIRLAKQDDINTIMQFIRENWNDKHIMANNRSFFEYEFLEPDGTVNFIIAVDKTKKTIESIYGFLKASHDKDNLDIWGSFLKTREDNIPLLGVELIKRRLDIVKCRNDIGVGANPKTTIPIMKLLKRYTAKMTHYYMLSDIKSFKIAKVSYRPQINKTQYEQYDVIKIDNIQKIVDCFDESKYKEKSPYKDYWYIEHRFFKHPIYKYDVYGVKFDNSIDALMVVRLQSYENRIAVRLVDYIGNRYLLPGTFEFWNKLLKNSGYEYIDFYCAGFEDYLVQEAGFTSLKDNDTNIIPNYFYPYEQKNVDIWVQSTSPHTLFTKADGDQDRPN